MTFRYIMSHLWGGANSIDKIRCPHKIGNDIHKELIAMWKALQNGWNPPEVISEEEYQKVRTNKGDYPDYYVGYVGFHATFGAKYFGGYARGFKADGVTPRIESNEAYRNTMKQLPNVLDVEFRCGDYLEGEQMNNAVIYCDPPYENTTKYYLSFDYNKFWDWCRKQSENNIVFVSSYEAPDDFECIWERDILANFDCNRGTSENRKRTEKLFLKSNAKN